MDASLEIKKSHKKRKFWVLIFVIITLCTGLLWQYIMSWYEKDLNQPPGQLIEVNNHKMHIYAKGEGSPTVVFTVGSGTPCAYTDYYFIQKELRNTVRTVSYDRPGYGWSEPTTVPRTIGVQVNELHVLLSKSGEKPPYILVGHSLSSLEVIHYAQLFKEEVSGIVLIDGGNPTDYVNYSEFESTALNVFFQLARVTGLVRAMGSAGVFPPFVGADLRHKFLPDELQRLDQTMFYNKLGNEANRDSLAILNENAKKVIESGKLGDMPLIILTAGDASKKWKESQVDLKTWSSNSKQEVISSASHYIHWDCADIIIEKIQELIINTKASNF